MKNLIKTIVLIALAVSCVNEIGNESIPEASRRYALSFEEMTKTEISGTGSNRSVSWTAGDQIKYYTESNQSNPASADVTIESGSAYVNIPRGRTDEFINAVYGATQLKSSSSTDKCMYISSPVKSNQRYTSFAQAHVCAAFSDDLEEPNLRFRNAACIVRFTSAADVHTVVFSGNNGEIISAGNNGDLKITCSSGGTLTIEPASGGQNSVTIATNGEEGVFFFAILPVSFDSGISVKCYDSYGALMFTKKTGGAINTVTSSGAFKMLDLGKAQDWINSAPPEPVDLGLSVKWANYNLGASKPEGYGDYFAWGEIAPKNEYKWGNYLYGTAKNGPFSKYVLDAAYGTIDHKLVLDIEDDAANAIWGDDWRMPTKEEVAELMNKCTWTWTTRNGVNGYSVSGNGNTIFLPANGMRTGTSLSDEGTLGNYWTSSISDGGTYYSISPFFSQSSRQSDNCYRYFGLGVRPVYGAVVPVSEITLPETLILTMGKTESATLTATVLPENATYKGLTWVSSDTSVATVDVNGKVTAVSLGTATVTVYSADGNKTVSCEVTIVQLVESITLDKTELVIYVGDDPVSLTATVLPNNATDKSLTWTSSSPSVATVDSDGKVTAVSSGSTKISVRANDDSNVSAACMVTVKLYLSKPDSAEAVDLGLPSGLKWASCNVGATKPEGYGGYFAWGETQTQPDKSYYDWSSYKWCYGSSHYLNKYCTTSYWSGSGSPDNKTILDSDDDAASANWGGCWRMPTNAEWTELKENCTWTWTSDYNETSIAGSIVTSNMSGYEDKSIFLPAAGYRGTNLYRVGSYGYYWSSSLNTDAPLNAWHVYFNSGNVYGNFNNRYFGFSVRPVSE